VPAKSQKQRAFLNMKFGHAWTKRHGFANKGKLPKKATKKGKGKRRGK
jgi:hypothetical protein